MAEPGDYVTAGIIVDQFLQRTVKERRLRSILAHILPDPDLHDYMLAEMADARHRPMGTSPERCIFLLNDIGYNEDTICSTKVIVKLLKRAVGDKFLYADIYGTEDNPHADLYPNRTSLGIKSEYKDAKILFNYVSSTVRASHIISVISNDTVTIRHAFSPQPRENFNLSATLIFATDNPTIFESESYRHDYALQRRIRIVPIATGICRELAQQMLDDVDELIPEFHAILDRYMSSAVAAEMVCMNSAAKFHTKRVLNKAFALLPEEKWQRGPVRISPPVHRGCIP